MKPLPYLLRLITLIVNDDIGKRILRRVPERWKYINTEVKYKGVHFFVNTGERRGKRMFFFGKYEDREEQAFLSFVRKGDLVFDVGANIGIYSLLAAKHGARVVAFEPSRQVLPVLRRNIESNGFEDDIQVVEQAIGSERSSVKFLEGVESNCGVGKIVPFSDNGQDGEYYDVDVCTLDSFVDQFGMPNVVKIDIEGAELLALRGASRMLSEAKNTVFLVEFHPEQVSALGGSIEDCLSLFAKNGFKSRELRRGVKERYRSWYIFSKSADLTS